ncbi:MAG TPA: hypothetical protein VEY09_18040 [Pyrinomonadaceae bacterium]|nr:hypothetical protein [Pyrinomonadaceae bacterium]
MNSQESDRPHRRRPRLAATLVALLISAATVAGLASAAGSSQDVAAPEPHEREFKDKVPAHVPIKVKIRKPEKVKNLSNDEWLGDLEVEVRNTGSKPIYFLRLILSFDDVINPGSGNRMGFSLVYGRAALIDLTKQPQPDDPSIPPGETHVFTLHETYVKGWKRYRSQVDPNARPKKIEIIFSALSHGDGTGYLASDGRPVRVKLSAGEGRGVNPERIAALRGGDPQAGCPPGPRAWVKDRATALTIPAAFLPVSFSPAGVRGAWRRPAPQSCCSGQGISCSRVKLVPGGNCFCPDAPPENGFRIEVDNFQCTDQQASCQIVQ